MTTGADSNNSGATESADGKRSRLTSAERRAGILLAARPEFAQHGFHGASTSRIARAAGCSEPMLYKHFSTKVALFSATLEEATMSIGARFDALIDAPGDLLTNWQGSLAATMHDPAFAEMHALRSLAVALIDEGDIREQLSAFTTAHIARVDRAIRRAKAEGHVRADVEPEYVAWMWSGIMHAACFRSVLTPDGFAATLPQAARFIDELRA